MNVKRKTVRFQDNASDLAVYEAISDYKSYGFRSESHMVVEAVKQFIHKDGICHRFRGAGRSDRPKPLRENNSFRSCY